MPYFEVEVAFDVYCSCGAPLCPQCTTTDHQRHGSGRSLTVEPCQKCLGDARDNGYDAGYDVARKEADDA